MALDTIIYGLVMLALWLVGLGFWAWASHLQEQEERERRNRICKQYLDNVKLGDNDVRGDY